MTARDLGEQIWKILWLSIFRLPRKKVATGGGRAWVDDEMPQFPDRIIVLLDAIRRDHRDLALTLLRDEAAVATTVLGWQKRNRSRFHPHVDALRIIPTFRQAEGLGLGELSGERLPGILDDSEIFLPPDTALARSTASMRIFPANEAPQRVELNCGPVDLSPSDGRVLVSLQHVGHHPLLLTTGTLAGTAPDSTLTVVPIVAGCVYPVADRDGSLLFGIELVPAYDAPAPTRHGLPSTRTPGAQLVLDGGGLVLPTGRHTHVSAGSIARTVETSFGNVIVPAGEAATFSVEEGCTVLGPNGPVYTLAPTRSRPSTDPVRVVRGRLATWRHAPASWGHILATTSDETLRLVLTQRGVRIAPGAILNDDHAPTSELCRLVQRPDKVWVGGANVSAVANVSPGNGYVCISTRAPITFVDGRSGVLQKARSGWILVLDAPLPVIDVAVGRISEVRVGSTRFAVHGTVLHHLEGPAAYADGRALGVRDVALEQPLRLDLGGAFVEFALEQEVP